MNLQTWSDTQVFFCDENIYFDRLPDTGLFRLSMCFLMGLQSNQTRIALRTYFTDQGPVINFKMSFEQEFWGVFPVTMSACEDPIKWVVKTKHVLNYLSLIQKQFLLLFLFQFFRLFNIFGMQSRQKMWFVTFLRIKTLVARDAWLDRLDWVAENIFRVILFLVIYKLRMIREVCLIWALVTNKTNFVLGIKSKFKIIE